jgi:glycosyltransferase involved in cell wall biosynthesis
VKILQVIARVNRGGTARWLNELTLGLRASGHEVLLAAGHVQEDETEDQIFGELGGHRIESLGRSISIFADVKALIEVRKYIVECKPDLINTHTAKAGLIGRLAAASIFKDRPAIVHTYHGHLLYGYFSKWKSKLFIIIEKFLVILSDVLISAGDKVKNELIEAGIGNENLYIVLRPGIQEFEHLDKQEVREELDIPSDKIVVGWLGRMAKIKRPERVIELAEKFPEVIFLMGGEGDLLEEIKVTAPENVVFMEWTKPEIIWGASDIALLTSDNEAQPISLIEASYASLPIVAQNVGSVSEVVDDGKTGILVSDFNSSVAALEKLINNLELRQNLGAAGKIYAKSRFSPGQFILGHGAAYSKALRK